jgi:CheY-like chemotaxis protein
MPFDQDSTSLPNGSGSARSGAEFTEIQDELACARAEFSALAGRLGHDLHGLLRNIIGFAQALHQRGPERNAGEQRWLQRIETTARQADTLVADLVTLSRVTVAELEPRTVDLLSLVGDCVQDLSPAAHGRGIQWVVEIDPAARVRADASLLRLALGHLMGNAVKFTRWRPDPRICVRLEEQPDGWRIVVSDNGAGFDPAYAHRLFLPLERLHGAAEFEGNGLGLATVKAVADKHGGGVHASGGPDQGATITFSWPRRGEGGDAATARAALSAQAALRVLLVDDEPLVLGALRAMIEREGHEVVAAPGPAAGLDTLDALGKPFDAVLSDWLMPDMEGPMFARAVKDKLPRVPVFLLTGQRPAVDGSYAVPDHVDGVLPKPLRIADLRRILRRLAAAA